MAFNTNNKFFPCNVCRKHTAICHASCLEYAEAKAQDAAVKATAKLIKKGDSDVRSVLVESRQRHKQRL